MEIKELGYLVVGAPTMDRWRDFARNVIGAMTQDRDDGGLEIKIDYRAARLIIRPHESDRILAAGWLVSGPDAYEDALDDLKEADVQVVTGTAEDCATRHVTGFSSLLDPSGVTHEIAWGPIADHAAFSSPTRVSGFVTGELGMGHFVLATPDHFDATNEFVTTVLGFGLSDILHIPLPHLPSPARVYFYHCANGRQHSLALAELPSADGCNHIMLEVNSVDDVGLCHDRALAENVQLTTTFGRHVNDGMFSFYMKTPAGFDIEIGAEGRVVDWSRATVFETTRGSHWGHHQLSGESD